MAELLDIDVTTVSAWRRKGLLPAHAYTDKNEYLYEHPGDNPPLKNKWKQSVKPNHSNFSKSPGNIGSEEESSDHRDVIML